MWVGFYVKWACWTLCWMTMLEWTQHAHMFLYVSLLIHADKTPTLRLKVSLAWLYVASFWLLVGWKQILLGLHLSLCPFDWWMSMFLWEPCLWLGSEQMVNLRCFISPSCIWLLKWDNPMHIAWYKMRDDPWELLVHVDSMHIPLPSPPRKLYIIVLSFAIIKRVKDMLNTHF